MARRSVVAAGSIATLLALGSTISGGAGAVGAGSPPPDLRSTLDHLAASGSQPSLTGPTPHPNVISVNPGAYNGFGLGCTASAAPFVLPNGIGSIEVLARGADGGDGQGGVNTSTPDGGAGAIAGGGIVTVPGETLNAKIGCLGADAPTGSAAGGAGGYGYAFGGNGGAGVSNAVGGAGGGGATALLRGTTPIIVAAGGGGAGSGGNSEGAGGNAGRNGHNSAVAPIITGGKAATTTTPGVGGEPGGGASPGRRGGVGGSVAGTNGAIGGGGGGGGLLGGGGGGSGELAIAYAGGGAGGRSLRPTGGIALNPPASIRSSESDGQMELIWLKSAKGGPKWPGLDIARGVAVHPSSGGYVLDDFGGIHPFHQGSLPSPAAAIGGPYWSGFDIARGIAVMPDGSGGFVLDGYGGLHGFKIGAGGTVPTSNGGPYWLGNDIARGIAIDQSGDIGIIVDGFGGIHIFGINGATPGSLPPGFPVPYHPGQDTVRGITLSASSGGVEVDLFGNLVPWGINPITGGGAPGAAFTNPFGGAPRARGVAVYGNGFPGGYVVAGDGSLVRFSPFPLG